MIYITEMTNRMLLEDRIDHLRDTFMDKLFDKWKSNQPNPERMENVPKQGMFNNIVKVDPTPQKKFVQWLIKLYLNDGVRAEDLYKATEYIQLFVDNQRSLPQDKRNIHAYGSLQELAEVVLPFKENPNQSNRQQEKALAVEMHTDDNSEVIYNSPTMKVVIPKTEAASCYFGRNTEWCTAATSSNNMFKHYNNSGTLYIIIVKDENKRIQIHIGNGDVAEEAVELEIRDENDNTMDISEVHELYPEISRGLGEERLAMIYDLQDSINDRDYNYGIDEWDEDEDEWDDELED